MKYLVLLTDGMADYPIDTLNNMTPLEYAKTPNLDWMAKTSFIGKVKTIPDGFPPGSDVANLSVMGYDPRKYYTGRSPLEAVSMGVQLEEDDLALRCNLVTLSDEKTYADKTMQDYSAGEISSDQSTELVLALQQKLGNDTIKFYPGISYRHLMVWKNGSQKQISLTPPHDISDQVIDNHLPQGEDSRVLLELMLKSEDILKNHPVNAARVKAGLNPATSIWFWGEGRKPSLPSFAEKYQLKGSVVAAVDLVKGLGISAGLDVITVKGATGGIETNFAGKAKAAIDELKAGKDFVYVHIESPDECGHQGDLSKKIWSIEQIDQQVVSQIRTFLDRFDQLRVMVLPDHPTPLALKTHSSDPVPFMIFDKNHSYKGAASFCERTAQNGIFIEEGHQMMDLFICGQN